MALPQPGIGSGDKVEPDRFLIDRDVPFMLKSYDFEISFGPFFPPDRIRIKKKRTVSKEDRLCEGQGVDDTGSKNRTIHVSGILRGYQEVRAFDDILDYGGKLELDTQGQAWEGQVLVENGQYEGPIAKDQQNPNLFHWKYSMDLISTGLDEYDHRYNNGIIDDGS